MFTGLTDTSKLIAGGLGFAVVLAFLAMRLTSSCKPVMSKKERQIRNEQRRYLGKRVLKAKTTLYEQYLRSTVGDSSV
jgi:hypothetical protein